MLQLQLRIVSILPSMDRQCNAEGDLNLSDSYMESYFRQFLNQFDFRNLSELCRALFISIRY